MPNLASERLRAKTSAIMKRWEERANLEIVAARQQKSLALRDSLPEYLGQLADALSTTIDRTDARIKADLLDSTRIGKKHGRERAENSSYTMDQLVLEYHILRQVICDVLEEDAILTPVEREVIVCSVEQAVNDAATQFSDSLREFRDRMTHTLAHDLRGPITSAKMGAQLISHQSTDAKTCRDIAARITVNMDRLDSMIHDLLDAAKVRAGQKLALRFLDCDLDLVARELIEDLNYTYPDRFILSSIGPCLGKWNMNGLLRIIENLATNAVKYGAPDTPVTIAISQTPEAVQLSVHNFGKTIPIAEQANLFEHFQRSMRTDGETGWGVGLTVVRGMAEAHNGVASLKSEDGKGTTVTVRIPKDAEA